MIDGQDITSAIAGQIAAFAQIPCSAIAGGEDTIGVMKGLQSEEAAKAIGDLDSLVQAVLASLPPSKPWQRQLLSYLSDIERQLQILRMTISMKRDPQEVKEALQQLLTVLRVAQRYVAAGRADYGTKAAVVLAYELGNKIELHAV